MSPQEQYFNEKLAEIDKLNNTDVPLAIEKAKLLFNEARKANNKKFQGFATRMIGIGFYKSGKLKEAISFFEASKNIGVQLDDHENVLNDLISIGVVYRNIGESDKALEYYLLAKKISEKFKIEKANLFNNIAVIYQKQKDFKNAVKYFKISIEIAIKQKNNNKQSLAYMLNNLAFAYVNLKEYEKAKLYHKEAINICENFKFKDEIISSYRGLGKILSLEGNNIDSYEMFVEALKIAESQENWKEYINASTEMSNVLFQLKKFDERTRRLKHALSLAIEHHQDSIMSCLEALLVHYEDMEDFSNSYHVLKQLSELRQQSIEIDRQHKITELQTQFEVQEKDKLLLQEKEFRQKLEAQNNTLSILNQDLQQFNYAVSHDLKEPLRSIRAYSRFLSSSLNEKLNEDEQNALKSLEESVRRVDSMIDDLLSFATLGSGDKATSPINLNEVLALVQADLQLRIKENNAQILTTDLPTIDGHKGMMVQLFQNLINNAIKFKKENENPIVEISWHQSENWHEIHVKDNGVGIAEKHQKDVFKLFKRLDKTKNIEGTGIGLSLCQKIITKMQGTIGLASVEGGGTTFIIKLPITLLKQ